MCPPQVVAALTDATVTRRNLFRLGLGTLAATAAAALPQTTQAANVRPSKFSHVHDLTHVLGPGMPVFPGAPSFKIDVFVTHKTAGYYGNVLTYWEHTGTHMDAPIHFAEKGLFVDQIAPENLVVPAVVIDIREKVMKNPDAMVMPDDIMAWEKRYGRIPDNAAIMMSSGWATRITSQDSYRNTDSSGVMHFPGFSKAAIEMLLTERKISGIGVDTLSLDHGPSATFDVHFMLLGANRWGLENVANLDAIPPSGAMLVVGAPKVASGSGGPTRVMALW